MPVLVPIVVAVAASAASYAVSAYLVAAGFTLLTGAIIGGLAGALVAYAGTALASGLLGTNKNKLNANEAALDAKRSIRSEVAPRRIVYGYRRVGGPIIYVASTGQKSEFLHMVIPVADHVVHDIPAVWLGNVAVLNAEIDGSGNVIAGKFAGKVRIKRHKGDQTTADADLVAESPDGWGWADRLTGVAYIYVRLEFDQDRFQNGVPNISADVLGKKLYDPRNSTTAYSTNWALVVYDYLRGEHGIAASAAEIDTASVIAAANLADEAVQITAEGGTQARYSLNGTFTLDQQPMDVLEEMVAAGGGALVYTAGTYRLYGGAYTAPAVTLTSDDLAGPVEVVTRPPRRELFNSVRGNFINNNAYWQASPFAPVENAAAIAADGEQIWRELELNWVLDATYAQRIAKQLLLRSRQGVTLRAPVKYQNLNFAVYDTVSVTLTDLGWSAKTFRVLSWQFTPDTGVILLTMQEDQASSYAWTYDEAANAPDVPDTTLVDPFDIPPASGLETSESLYQTRDGAGVRTKVRLTWGASSSAFVTGYEVQFKAAASSVWTSVGGGNVTAHDVEDVAAGTYDFRVRAVSIAARSVWAEVRRSIGALAAQPPVDVSGLSLQSVGGMAFLRWTRHPDLDVRVGGRFEIRHTPVTATPVWADGTTIGEATNGETTFLALPLLSGTYMIKAIDAGGVYSVNAAAISASQATALTFSSLATQTEHTAFSGTKTNTTVASSRLKLSTAQSTGSYTFAAGIDLTSVKNVRVTRHLLAEVVNETNVWDSRTDLMDAWLTIDDAVIGGEADAWVEARTTQDDPGGTPTWDDWRKIDASEFRARAFQFRAQLRRYNATYNIEIAELKASVDEVV